MPLPSIERVHSVRRVERSFLQPKQFQRELWPALLQFSFVLAIVDVENVPVVPEEDEISLMVENDDTSSSVIFVGWEPRPKHP